MGAGRLTGGAPYPVDGTRSPAGVDQAGSGLRHATPPRALSRGTMPGSDNPAEPARSESGSEREGWRTGGRLLGLGYRRLRALRLRLRFRCAAGTRGHEEQMEVPAKREERAHSGPIGMCAHLRVARRSPLAPLRRAVLGLLLGWAELTSGDPCRTTLCALHEKE